MNLSNRACLFAVIGLIPLFTGCGGSSSGEPPAGQGSNPPPAPPSTVTIFPGPSPDTYVSLGSSTTSAGDGYSPVAANARLTDVSLEDMNQPLVRYTSSGRYEIQLPGTGFDRLVHYKGLANPTSNNNFFQPSSARQNAATFIVTQSRLDGYRHSELSGWTDGRSINRMGFLAFGTPTPASSIASSGSATYTGHVTGLVDITYPDYLYGGLYFSGASGTITLTVDFAARTITGTITVEVELEDETVTSTIPLPLATLPPGADNWWGSFETSESGFNEFKIRLTGLDANEMIGGWSIPIVIDGQPHQMMGAWIAMRE